MYDLRDTRILSERNNSGHDTITVVDPFDSSRNCNLTKALILQSVVTSNQTMRDTGAAHSTISTGSDLVSSTFASLA